MEHKNPFELTPEQNQTNPNKYWEGFLGQKVTLIAGLLKEHGNITDPSVAKALAEALAEVPKNRQGVISKDELLIRSLEFYAKEGNGFVSEKLEKEYVNVMAEFLLARLGGYDYDTVNAPLQEEINVLLKEKGIPLRENSVLALRDKFWAHFAALKMEEYARETSHREEKED